MSTITAPRAERSPDWRDNTPTPERVSPEQPVHEAEHEHRDHVRSPVDVLRFIVALVIVLFGIGLANLLDSALLGLSIDSRSAMNGVPGWIHDVTGALLGAGVLALVLGSLIWALVTTRFRRLTLLLSAIAGAAAISIGVGHILLAIIDGDVQAAFNAPSPLLRYSSSAGVVHPGDPLLAAAVAMAAVGSSFLRRNTTHRIAALLTLYVVATTLTTPVPALGLVGDIGAGLAVGSLLLLIAGRHDLAPSENDLRTALSNIGTGVETLRPLDVDARGSAPWMGVTADGQRVFVKALGRDERSADLMFRFYRWVKLRRAGDHRPFASLRRSVEHEALVSLQASALGVRTPNVLGVAHAGIDGMALAYEGIDGRSADAFDDIDDAGLESIWRMVSRLHARRIAHRDLRLANILIDAEGEPLLIDFGFSELAASDQLLGTDVAELLASTASLVGTERAVAAAHRATGLDELERALPWLQPSALSAATRDAIGGDKGLKPIRRMLVDRCGVPEEAPVKLQRVDAKMLFILASVALSAWFLIPQLADVDDIWRQVEMASFTWAIAAVAFSTLTYGAATTALLGAIPLRLRFLPALAAQLASSFANRVTPAKVGGVATNIRYFQKHGVPTAVSITAVGLNALAGLIVHVSLTLTFLLLSSNDQASSLPVPSPQVVGLGVAIAAAVILASTALPATRRLLVTHVVPQLKAGWQSMQTIGRNPGRIAALFGGSAVITLAYLGAMVASLNAFGSTASFPAVALLFLTGSAVANSAPTPGGLGAAEAALIAALSAVEDPVIVIPAVFLYRFVTFWLPILPGWIALTWLRSSDLL